MTVLPISIVVLPLFLLKIFIKQTVLFADNAEEEFCIRALFQEGRGPEGRLHLRTLPWSHHLVKDQPGEIHLPLHVMIWSVTRDRLEVL